MAVVHEALIRATDAAAVPASRRWLIHVEIALDRRLPRPKNELSTNKTIRYDTRCYSNVRSKAINTSQLNLPHGTDN